MNIKSVIGNVLPAFVVMCAGLGGAYLVYETYFEDNIEAGQVATIEPAAGEEANLFDGIEDVTLEGMGESVSETTDAAIEGTVDAGETIAAEAGDAVDATVEAGEKVAAETGEAVDAGMENVSEAIDGMAADLEGTEAAAGDAVEDVTDEAADAAADVEDAADEAVSGDITIETSTDAEASVE